MNTELRGYMRGLAVGLSMEKKSKTEIARLLKVSRGSVNNWINNHNRNKFCLGRSSGRRVKTTARNDRLLLRLALKHKFSSAKQLLSMWRVRVGVRTVYNRLLKAGLRKRRPYVAPLLTNIHKKMREKWAMRKCLWREVWGRIIFSDESRFTRLSNDRRVMVWRRKCQRFHENNIKVASQGNGGSVLVWGAIWKGGRSPLLVLRKPVTGNSYLSLLQQFFESENLPQRFMFQDDNAPPHRSKLVMNFHRQRGTRHLDWPSRSPDLNPIEHVWDLIGRRVSRELFDNTKDLERKIVQEWNQVHQSDIDNLIDSMPRRVKAVITQKGGITHY